MPVKKIGWIGGLIIIILLGIWLRRPAPEISTLIVPHHDLVASQRGDAFSYLRRRIEARRVILISPNHYDSGVALMQTTAQDFTTKNGNIQIDAELLAVAKQHGVKETPITFEAEHGVQTILPDIAKNIPNTTILPLIIRETTMQERVDELMADLYKTCPDCLVVASVDFSHYQPYQQSELHDKLTRRGMQSMDRRLIETKAEIGEPRVLSAAMKWAQLNGTLKYKEYNHTNATAVVKQFYAEGTTHFYSWYETGKPVQPKPEVTFSFVGDLMFDRTIRERFHPDYQKVIKQLGDRVLWGADVVMGNLEGPITDEQTLPSEQAKPRFRFSPMVRHTLEDLRFTQLSLRNNHVYDTGEKGFNDTLAVLNASKITPMPQKAKPQITMGADQRIITFAVDTATGNELSQKDFEPYKGSNDNIVVYAHWGPEYELKPSVTQREQARQWIDWGADLVVGTGPHVVQPAEVYKNRPIVYSLGNFIFDLTDNSKTSTGLILSGSFTDKEITLQPLLATHPKLTPVLGRSLESEAVVEWYFKDLKPWLKEKKGGLLFSIRK